MASVTTQKLVGLGMWLALSAPCSAVALADADERPPGPATPIAADAALYALPSNVVMAQADMAELPEPTVLTMMVLGVCLIGYRTRRGANEPFR